MILSLFGPDGVGKSTVAKLLASDGWFVISGTGVASWPDKTWHNELVAAGIDEPTYESDEHFLEKIRRCHELARQLEHEHRLVAIDSDPLHKTLMHDFVKGRDRFEELYTLAFTDSGYKAAHVCLSLDGDDGVVAEELQRRVNARGRLQHFDPQSIEALAAMVRACREICAKLEAKGERVMRLSASRPIDQTDLAQLDLKHES